MPEMRVYECLGKDLKDYEQIDPEIGGPTHTYDGWALILAQSPAHARYRFSIMFDCEYTRPISIKVRKDIVIGPGEYQVQVNGYGWEIIPTKQKKAEIEAELDRQEEASNAL